MLRNSRNTHHAARVDQLHLHRFVALSERHHNHSFDGELLSLRILSTTRIYQPSSVPLPIWPERRDCISSRCSTAAQEKSAIGHLLTHAYIAAVMVNLSYSACAGDQFSDVVAQIFLGLHGSGLRRISQWTKSLELCAEQVRQLA